MTASGERLALGTRGVDQLRPQTDTMRWELDAEVIRIGSQRLSRSDLSRTVIMPTTAKKTANKVTYQYSYM